MEIRWFCKQHGDGTAEIIIPTATFIPTETRESAGGKPCAVCKKTIHARYADSAYHCSEVDCRNVCHLSKGCSGFVIPRGTDRNRVLAMRQWKCPNHSERTETPRDPTETENRSTTTTTPPSMEELRATGITFEEAQQQRERCAKCHFVLRCNARPIRCNVCQTGFHSKCSIGARWTSREAAEFRCTKCDAKEKIRLANQEMVESIPSCPGKTVSQPTARAARPQFKIVQWNADGIRAKMFELRERLLHSDIDVCAIQESKLRKADKTPTIEGYSSLRADRKLLNGGGLLLFIKKDLIYEPLMATERAGQEVQTVRIKADKNDWITLVNVYLPNTETQTTRFDPGMLSSTARSVIIGDLNAHSRLWDYEQTPDSRGQEIEDWIIEHDLFLLNNGSTTRHSRITGRGSTPDLSVCGSHWTRKATWEVLEPIGDSDHLPISITINHRIKYQPVLPRKASWKRNGVNWEEFSTKVDEQMTDLPEEPNLSVRIARFTNILTSTAEVHVGKSKPRPQGKSWMTPDVRAKIRTRNRLRRTIGSSREEWIQACREANDTIKEAKETSWRELLEDAMTTADETKMWKIIRGLNGTPDANSPNEAMKHEGRTITDNEAKGNIFAQHYARISNPPMKREDRDLNRKVLKRLEAPTVDDESCCSLKMGELRNAIKRMKRKGAAGPDGIPPTFLKALGPCALTELLEIFNMSFLCADCPRVWRVATIIPLLKNGKSPSEVASYRPVSLTSCVAKLMERVLADRLYYIAETKRLFSHFQAGFRKGRCCEDQILKIVQAIEDGFQKKPMERSVLTLLDFSKAYDTVWRERLLLSMIEAGIPLPFIRWIRAFLADRRARVRINNALSESRKFRQGLPQGSVLAPLLFLFYINNLAEQLTEENEIAMFADDVTILATNKNKQLAEESAQRSIDVVCEWSR